MGRTISGTLSAILSNPKRDLDWTIDLTFPDISALHFATSVIPSLNGYSYTNDLETVSEIRQSIESPTNTVAVGLQNEDRVLSQHIATYWQKWRSATAIIGRNYYAVGNDGLRTGTSAWIEMYRGSVQRPNSNDLQTTFDVIPDTTALGMIIAARSLDPNCPFRYKGPQCGSTSGLSTCDHTLKSTGGCDGRGNSHRYGGCEHRYNPDVSAPGTGGNSGGGAGIDPPCPRLDQYLLVRGRDGGIEAKAVCFFTEEEWLWDPIERAFFPTRTARIVRGVDIWEMVAANGAACYSSYSHRPMPNEEHPTGLPAETIEPRDELLTVLQDLTTPSYAVISRPTGEKGDVMFIEMDGGHHYAAGDSVDKLIAAHNSKSEPPWNLP